MSDLRATIAAVRSDHRKRDVRCPSHPDHWASLGVLPGDEPGKIVLTCQTGCTTEAVLAAGGLTWADLFPEKTSTKASIVATYQYMDEGGRHLYDVVRFEPEGFRQRRADGVWKMTAFAVFCIALTSCKGSLSPTSSRARRMRIAFGRRRCRRRRTPAARRSRTRSVSGGPNMWSN